MVVEIAPAVESGLALLAREHDTAQSQDSCSRSPSELAAIPCLRAGVVAPC